MCDVESGIHVRMQYDENKSRVHVPRTEVPPSTHGPARIERRERGLCRLGHTDTSRCSEKKLLFECRIGHVAFTHVHARNHCPPAPLKAMECEEEKKENRSS